MGTSQGNSDKQPTPPDRSTVILLLGTIGDTTWRMFIPTIGLMLVGLTVDTRLRMFPIGMSVGFGVGVYIAYLLVRRQMKKVKE